MWITRPIDYPADIVVNFPGLGIFAGRVLGYNTTECTQAPKLEHPLPH